MSSAPKETSLLHLTLHASSGVSLAAYGNFTATRAQEVACVRGGGQWLALLRPNEHTGKMDTVAEENVFGIIRCMAAFRLVGGTRDYLVLGSDSGRITIVQWSATGGRFVKVHEETYGKSGVRRLVPGQYVAVDPKGRSVMLAAFEKQKLVWVLNRDQAANLTISSPLEAHKSGIITFALVALDVSFDNPITAALEADPNDELTEEEAAAVAAGSPAPVHKYLTFYELDLGLNHVTRSYTHQVDPTANLLIPVPGGESGPGGVLICAENCVYYKSSDNGDESHRQFLRAPFPKRFGFDTNEKGTLITSFTAHVQKGLFFFLLQSEYGDLFKVSLAYEEDAVDDLQVKYFDTLPVSNAMVVLKSGFLFNASESGNSYLWQFQGIGDDDDPTPFTSSKMSAAAALAAGGADADDDTVIFKPRVPTNLALIDDMESGAPLLDMRVADLAREYTPQIYTLVGRGARSSLRVLRHGLAVSEVAVSELPGNPSAVWAVKKAAADAFMSYIVVSFVNATIVLSIGETVVEVKDSGLLDSTATMHVALLADDSLLQIHSGGMRHIRPDKRIHEWKTPGKKSIQCCAANEKQIVLALTGGELVYFELDMHAGGAGGAGTGSGNLIDVQRKDMGNDVAALAIAPVPEGRLRASFLAVGLYNNTVRVLSLEPQQTLNQLAMQALPAQPTALVLASMAPTSASAASGSGGATPNLYLYIGLTNGILMRSLMDESAGSLSDTRKRFLGTRPVRLHRVRLRDATAVVALSSRNWLSYIHSSRFHMVPLSYDILEYASPFSSEQCPEGIVAISANSLRIVTIEKVGAVFNQTVMPLRNTPRRMAVHPVTNQLVIIETDHNAYTEKQKLELRATMREVEAAGEADAAGDSMDLDGAPAGEGGVKAEQSASAASDASLNEVFMGSPHAGEGAWASSIRIVDPIRLETLCLLSLEDNEAAFSLQILQFQDDPSWYLVVGTVQNYVLAPRAFTSGFLHVYKFVNAHTQLQFLHKTPVKEVPLALGSFQRKLVVGVGKCLRLYELGKRQLLRKCENKNFPQVIQSIQVPVQGGSERIYVGDLCEAFHFCLYRKATNEIEIFADCTAPRYLTAQALLDIDTVAGADKFGNIFLSRLGAEVSKQFLSGSASAGQDQTIATLMNKYGKSLQGAQHKLVDIANIYVGETVTSLQKVALVPGSSEVLLYATLQGGIGVLLPFTSREDVEFFSHLEMHLRQEAATSSLTGRDHLAYRGYYFPVKNVVDGDLCEHFTTHLDHARQTAIAEELVCTPQEVAKRLEDIRNRVL